MQGTQEEAEGAVLGAMLLQANAAAYAVAELEESDFYGQQHGLIFRALSLLVDEGNAVDGVLLAERLNRMGKLEEAGGPAMIYKLMDTVPHSEHVRYYCRILKDWSKRRKLYYLSLQLRGRTSDIEQNLKTFDVEETTQWIESELMTMSGMARDGLKTMEFAVQQLLRHQEQKNTSWLSTGFTDIDSAMSLQPGRLYLLGARPGMGKTSFVTQVLKHVAANYGHTYYASLEMEDWEIAEKLCGPSMRHASATADLPILMTNDEYNYEQIASRIRLTARRHRVRLVVVDHLHLIEVSARMSPEERVSYITSNMKRLARSLKIPILLVAQLNREVERRDDKRPRNSDLRGGGEQDADVIAFLYRHSQYDPDADPGEAEFIITKNRTGQGNKTIKLGWHGPETRFSDWSQRPVEADDLFQEASFGDGVDL